MPNTEALNSSSSSSEISIYSGATNSTKIMGNSNGSDINQMHNEESYLLHNSSEQRSEVQQFLLRCCFRIGVPRHQYEWNHEDHESLETFIKRKTFALALLVIALSASNVIQMQNVIAHFEYYNYFFVIIPFLIINLALQFYVLIALYIKSRFDINDLQEYSECFRLNDIITAGILTITVINFCVSVFSIVIE